MTTPKNSSPNYVFENKGVLVIDSALKVSLAPMNLAAYNKNGLVSQFSLPLLLEVKVKQREYEKLSDFHRLYLCIANLLASQDTIKSSAVKSKKSYYPDDTFPAVIVNKDRMRIEARSLDPDYKEIRGNVRHHNPANPFEIKDIHQYLKEGDIIMAKMAKDSEFAMDICEDIATYYSDYASADAGHVVPAVFLSKGTNGDHWISDAGVKIYINGMHLDYLSDDILQQYEDAINSGVPIRLKVKDETPDSNTNNSQVFAWVDTDNGPIFSDADPFTPEMAIRNFVNEYLHECREEAEKVLARSQSANVQPISRTEADTLASVLWRMVESGIPAPKERLKFTGALEMLCKMLSREQDCKMLNYERHFLDTLVDFAASGGAKRPEAKRLPTDPDLTAGHEHLLEIIRTYKSEPDRKITPGESEQSAVCANEVENLIKASNALRNIMDDREIHKIFLAILRKLDVEDEYVPDAEGKTYYGSESINLEFKTSSVFPPANRRRYMSLVSDFNIQKWAILKTVCGFLNSRSGGDLLIGVNDSGYAVGLADDIKELFRLNQIPAETADAYRLFSSICLTTALRWPAPELNSAKLHLAMWM